MLGAGLVEHADHRGRVGDVLAAGDGDEGVGDPDLLSGKVQWLLNPGGTAVLMYNGREPEDMDFYRNLSTKMHGSDGAPMSDEFWTERQDNDPDWLTVVGGTP